MSSARPGPSLTLTLTHSLSLTLTLTLTNAEPTLLMPSQPILKADVVSSARSVSHTHTHTLTLTHTHTHSHERGADFVDAIPTHLEGRCRQLGQVRLSHSHSHTHSHSHSHSLS